MTNGSTGRLLVVDDNKVNRLLLGRSLEQQGHTVEMAENGRQALEMLHARFAEEQVNVAAVHARDLPSAQDLFERARIIFNTKELILTELSIAVAANLGPGTVGLIIYPAGG